MDIIQVQLFACILYMHMTAAAFSKQTDLFLSDEEVAKTTHAASRRSLHLQRYFVEQGVNNADHAAIDRCADEVFRTANVKMRPVTAKMVPHKIGPPDRFCPSNPVRIGPVLFIKNMVLPTQKYLK